MTIVDTHSHAGINWFEPVEMILYQMDLNSVDKTVEIQHNGNYHNHYIIECTRRFPGRFGAVIWVDVTRPDAPETLERLSKEEGVSVFGFTPPSVLRAPIRWPFGERPPS